MKPVSAPRVGVAGRGTRGFCPGMTEIGNTQEDDEAFADLRDAPRFALLIRTAKIVCPRGEYLCIVRDISASGVRLKLFHPLPADTTLRLELSNGDSYALERRWEKNGHAGFRFVEAVNIHGFMEEPSSWPRRPIRLRVRVPSTIHVGDVANPATVLNLSRYGARIEADVFMAIEQKIRLDVPGLPSLSAGVCWRSGKLYGLILRQTFTFEELARHAAALQPIGGIATGNRLQARRA